MSASQTVGSFNFGGSDTFTLNKGTSGSGTEFTSTATLGRVGNGTVLFAGNSLYGTATEFFKTLGTAPAALNGIVAPYYVMGDTAAINFANYGANGFVDVASYGTLTSPGATVVATSAASATNWGSISVYALQLTGALSGTGTITIGSGGLILSTTGATQAPAFTFGAEGIIFSNVNNTLSGVLTTTNGLTFSGTGTETITGINVSGSLGTIAGGSGITINSGTVIFATAAEIGNNSTVNGTPTAPAIVLNGGTLSNTGANSINFLDNITVNGDSQLTSVASQQERYGSLTFGTRSGSVTDPVVLYVATGGAVFDAVGLGATAGGSDLERQRHD